jgi:hypothetical protein
VFCPDAASFFYGQNALYPAKSLVTLTAKAAFSPQYAKAQSTFGPIIGQINTVFIQKDPQ